MVMTAGAAREKLEKSVEEDPELLAEGDDEDIEFDGMVLPEDRSSAEIRNSTIGSIIEPQFERISVTSFFTETPFKTKASSRAFSFF